MDETTTFDGDNSYPDCAQCGRCCGLNVLAVTADELAVMQAYIAEHDVKPIDRGKERCCLQSDAGTCMIWEARPQPCRLYHCRIPRWRLLEMNPSVSVPADPPLIDMHEAFICGNTTDPRYRR